ncbi:histidine kinase [Actinoplanes lobatus]|uniref:Histidine kinase n=1 Tax=Actinoplanes lobatus TaxID=113568 RepID=A0A7W7HGW3_9ACTN|nr:histidine kinase [Actinoplanes lobatus]MBB4750321.1 two-component system sensor histidine kinase DesK [Actinoplanes lobatus]GGN71363.1 histidine kinase [Actinoplanes lobatus]GIE41885.1 histidine kinase [Actinoplanes lobatus]
MALPTSVAPGRGVPYGWVFSGIWLFYLGENLTALAGRPDGVWRDVGLVAVALFAVTYVVAARLLMRRNGPRVVLTWTLLLTMVALTLLQAPAAGRHSLTCAVYIAGIAMTGLPWRQGAAVAVVVTAAVESSIRLAPGWQTIGHGYALAVILAAAAAGGIRLALERQARLLQAQHELAQLAVADERARIADNLHDLLGHSLTVVAVKAELAQRLLDVDLDRARTELRDLESLARDALADVRATALGVRGISLPGEIAAARAALAAADVQADLPTTADEVPTLNRELFAWTIREAVTNIVRHSGARHAAVRLRPDSVEIVDDGRGHGDGPAAGQGLPGLRRRAAELGAHLTAGRRQDGPGFRVRVEVPS